MMKRHVGIARDLAALLDNKFSFMGMKFGLDPIIGLVPILGDVIGMLLAIYILWIGHQMRIPAEALAKMWRNVLFDTGIGMVPIIGDVSDFFFKASSRNLAILEKYIKEDMVVEGEVVV